MTFRQFFELLNSQLTVLSSVTRTEGRQPYARMNVLLDGQPFRLEVFSMADTTYVDGDEHGRAEADFGSD